MWQDGSTARRDNGYDDHTSHYGPRGHGVLPRSPSELLEPSRAPQPPRLRQRRQRPRMVNLIRRLNSALTFLLMVMMLIGGLFYVVRYQFDRAGPLGYSTVVVVPKGNGLRDIAAQLETEGIIADRRLFVAGAFYFRAQQKLKAGEYEIKRNASMRQVLDTLVDGKAILYKVSAPEGLTSKQIVDILNAEDSLTGEITEIPAEGSLLPDTYKVARGMDRQDLIERMRNAQVKFVEKIWPNRAPDLPFSTIEEAITLASIVEKETGRADERDRVAGVFVNRLKRKMRLQSDPTIIYGITLGKGPLDRPIYRSDIDGKTPYNTYQIDALPPTPIANPGRAAIEAVLNPAKTTDLFFVADGSGGHVFAPTYAEHKKNVLKWRAIEREMKLKPAKAKLAANSGVPGASAADVAELTPADLALAASNSDAEASGSDGGGVVIPLRNPKR